MLSSSTLLVILWAVIPASCSVHECFSEVFGENQDWHNNSKINFNGHRTEGFPLPRMEYQGILEMEINKQINRELFAHYTYLSMAYHFDRDDIQMPGFHKFFLKMAEEEHEHAQMFMKYQNKRGGRIYLKRIEKPCHHGIWGNGTQAMRRALELEKLVNNALLDLHNCGSSANDPQFLDFLESNFLGEQVESIKQLSDYVNTLQRLDSPLGEYQFDKMTLQNSLETKANLFK